MTSLIAVGMGSAIGGVLRWQLSALVNERLNSSFLGTWFVNSCAGFLVGLGIAFFSARHDLPEAFRLFVVVGFCGGFSTFSAFSADVVSLLSEGRHQVALGLSLAHILVSVGATFAGLGLVHMVRTVS